MGYGFNGYIGIGRETSFGSAVAVTDYFEALSEDIQVQLDRFETKNIVATVAEPDDDVGLTRVGGSILMSAHPVSMGFFLKSAMQLSSVSVVTSGFLWTHDYYTAAADFAENCPVQPYTYEVFRDVGTSVRYGGVVVNALDLTYTPNQSVRMRAQLLGRNSAVIAKSTSSPTFPSSPSKPFKFDTASISIGGVGNARLEALSIAINGNMQGVPALVPSSDIYSIARGGPQMININGTLSFVDNAEYADFMAQTERAFMVNVTKANSFRLTALFPKFVYTAFPTAMGGRERLTVAFNAKAQYHAGSGTAAKISLTTTKSFY